jgi:hypothetical protein
MEFEREKTSAAQNPVVLVDGVGRARVHDVGSVSFLPSVIGWELDGDQQRVVMQGDGMRVVVSRVTFERTDEKVQGMRVYRLTGVTGRPVVRMGYR